MTKVFTQLQETPITEEPTCVTFGTFDGVHLGHQYIFTQVKKIAAQYSLKTVCLTFSNHPSDLLRPNEPLLQLTTEDEKRTLIQSQGFDFIIMIPFDQYLQMMSASRFLFALRKMTSFSHLVVGADVAFGRDREGNQQFLEKYSKQQHFQVHFLERFQVDGEPVSSSRIRRLVAQGDLEGAGRLLGRIMNV